MVAVTGYPRNGAPGPGRGRVDMADGFPSGRRRRRGGVAGGRRRRARGARGPGALPGGVGVWLRVCMRRRGACALAGLSSSGAQDRWRWGGGAAGAPAAALWYTHGAQAAAHSSQ